MIRKVKIVRKLIGGPLSATLLLLLYFIGNVEIQGFHDIVHSFERSLHTPAEEADPCHRAIYHDPSNDGCDHETHVRAVKQCPLCHVIPINVQHFEASNSFVFFSTKSDHEIYQASEVLESQLSSPQPRGPPTI
jgi:hypothetical protein